jgi:hypothetical protein
MDSLTQDKPAQDSVDQDNNIQKNTHYRDLAERLIRDYAASDRVASPIETHLVIDPTQGHYQWWNIGWRGFDRIHRCIIHLEVRDSKIWLQENKTEHDPAAALVNMGVPNEDIILGLQPPAKRPYTDYGVA